VFERRKRKIYFSQMFCLNRNKVEILKVRKRWKGLLKLKRLKALQTFEMVFLGELQVPILPEKRPG